MLFYSLTPHLHQALYVKGMVYIIVLLSNLAARDLAARQLPVLAGWRELGLCRGLAGCFGLRRLLLPPAQPGPVGGQPGDLRVCGCYCALCIPRSCACTSFAGATRLNPVFSLARGKVKGNIPACPRRHE